VRRREDPDALLATRATHWRGETSAPGSCKESWGYALSKDGFDGAPNQMLVTKPAYTITAVRSVDIVDPCRSTARLSVRVLSRRRRVRRLTVVAKVTDIEQASYTVVEN
jgi:hypothetical protein